MHPETTPRQRRREARLQEIREEALALVIDEGIDRFSVHKLADRLDVTAGALYRYYESVDHLLMAMQIDVLEEFDSYLETVLVKLKTKESLERIVGLCRAYIALDELMPERFRLIGRFVSNPEPVFNDDAARSGMATTLTLLGRLSDLIAEAQTEGALNMGPPMDRAILAWSSLQGLVDRRKLARLNPEIFDMERLATQLLATLLVGWGADAEATRHALDLKLTTTTLRNVLESN